MGNLVYVIHKITPKEQAALSPEHGNSPKKSGHLESSHNLFRYPCFCTTKTREEKKCSKCPKVDDIKKMSDCGYRIGEIAEKVGGSQKIAQYLKKDDFHPGHPSR